MSMKKGRPPIKVKRPRQPAVRHKAGPLALLNFIYKASLPPLCHILLVSQCYLSIPKGMGNIHFHIFFDDLVKSGLRHLVDVGQCRLQIDQRCKAEIALRQIHRAQLTGEVENIFKQLFVNCLQC